jgi:acyl-CoA synthetase (AMP-forming)/AMP-acid ligase II
MLELIEKYEITAFCGTPTLLSMMARFNRSARTDTLKHICISGECMSRETGHKISQAFSNSNIYHVYGLTEACPRVSYLPPKYFSDHPDCVGIPLKSVSIRIINMSGDVCKENEEGMLFVKGDNVMLGYYRDPNKTQKILRDGWLCTGDIATINKSGFLKINGRNDDLIIKSGMNIYPAEIEAELKKDPRVKEVLIYGINNQFGTQIGLKMVGDFKSVEDIKQLCVSSLPSFQVPSIIELTDELPKNGSGKIIRR